MCAKFKQKSQHKNTQHEAEEKQNKTETSCSTRTWSITDTWTLMWHVTPWLTLKDACSVAEMSTFMVSKARSNSGRADFFPQVRMRNVSRPERSSPSRMSLIGEGVEAWRCSDTSLRSPSLETNMQRLSAPEILDYLSTSRSWQLVKEPDINKRQWVHRCVLWALESSLFFF